MNNVLTDIANVKIESITAKPITIPLLKPFSNHLRVVSKSDGLICCVHTNMGISGQGLVYGLGKIDHKKAMEYIDNIASKILNQPIQSPKHIWTIMFDIGLPHSFELNNAIAAIDIAIWDIYLKEKNMPLHQIFGDWRMSVPVYDTAGWLSLSEKELIDACKRNSSRGVKAFKVRLGHQNDRERIGNLRKIMGKEFDLMADANQRFEIDEALRLIQDLTEFNLTWIEEPVSGESLDDLKQLAEKSAIPIALGENIKSKKVFEEVCKNKLASYLQPDIRNCMGLTRFIEFCQLTHQYKIPVCNHLMPELSSSIIAGCQNGISVEYLDIIPSGAFTHNFEIINGQIRVPSMAGTGVELTKIASEKYSI